MRRFPLNTCSSLSFAALAIVLAGCADGTPTGNNPPVDPAVGSAQVSEMGSAALEGADETLNSMLESVGGAGFAAFASPNPCPTITVAGTNAPPSVVVTLQFGDLPENVTFPPAADDPCLKQREEGPGQAYLFGSLVVTKAGAEGREFERSEALDNLGFVATETADFSTFWRGQRDGTRSFTRDVAGKLVAMEDLTTTRKRKTDTDEFGNTVTSQLEWTFTPVAGELLQEAHDRPSGTIVVTGGWRFVGQVRVEQGEGDSRTSELVDADVTHTVRTNVPLEYDATCSGPARRRIKAGQLQFTRTSGDASRSFTLTWTACGEEPTKAEVGAPT